MVPVPSQRGGGADLKMTILVLNVLIKDRGWDRWGYPLDSYYKTRVHLQGRGA